MTNTGIRYCPVTNNNIRSIFAVFSSIATRSETGANLSSRKDRVDRRRRKNKKIKSYYFDRYSKNSVFVKSTNTNL